MQNRVLANYIIIGIYPPLLWPLLNSIINESSISLRACRFAATDL